MATNEKTGPKAAKAASKVLKKWQHRQGFKNSGRVRFKSSAGQEKEEVIKRTLQ
ncbi:hypothetical protein [Xanthomonas sp. BRIP62409]|uniref:hypothetical protein n=1 Tax=Xanthomonas sp. BRIP62409 TaxID=2182388 RepID=UPI0013DE9FBB|nr:hypothetical protein [Xanthomonas sp. BRIP62409]